MNEIFWQGTDLKTKILLAYLRSPNHPMKIRLIRWLIRKIFPEGVVVKNKLGAKICVQPNDYIGWAILKIGRYEGVTLNLASEILKNGGIFLDIGANIGLFTCFLGVLENVECYSVEPSAKNFVKLQKNISLNHKLKAKTFNLALDKSIKLLEIEDFNPDNSGTVRVLLEDKNTNSTSHTVAATTLQELLLHTNIKNVTLMKIDVEGYELPILEGMDWKSSLRPHNVIIEFTDYSSRSMGTGRQSVLEFFMARGYEGFTVDGKPLSLEQNSLEDNAWFRDTTRCQQDRQNEDASFHSYSLL